MTLVIPSDVFNLHTVVLGKTRAGKSSTMRGFAEWLLDHGKPLSILDPKGDWWGLKSSADGKRPGYPIIIFGGLHADVPIDEHSGADLGELIATGNRPCIIDVSQFLVGERTRFFRHFAQSLFRHTRGRRIFMIDECHNFAPQGKVFDIDSGKMLHWANKLAAEGGGKGISLISASQRPQKVHKDFLTCHETLIAMRVIHPLDRGAMKDWIDGCPDPVKGKEVLGSLASMARGEGWVWSPEIGFGPKLIKFPMFKTFDSFKPAEEGHDAKLEGWASVDLAEITGKLAAVAAEAKANDPKALKARIAELERQMTNAAAAASRAGQVPDPATIEAARAAGYAEGHTAARQEGYAAGAEAMRRSIIDKVTGPMAEDLGALQGIAERLSRRLAIDVVTGIVPPPLAGVAQPVERRPSVLEDPDKYRRIEDNLPPLPSVQSLRIAPGPGEKMPTGERAILVAVAQHGSCTREQLTVLTGYKKSSRDTYIQRLGARDYIETVGGGVIAPTDAGIKALGSDYERLPAGRALQRYWLERLPEGERKVLQVLIDAYPKSIDRSRIDDATGYRKSSRDTYIQRLSARQLLTGTGRGEIRASDNLF